MRRRRTFFWGSWRFCRHLHPLAASLARQAKSLQEAGGGSHDDEHGRSFPSRCSCVLDVVSAPVDPLTSWRSHSALCALLTICRSFLRGSVRCLAIASPIAPSARVAISSQHFSASYMCSHCAFTARTASIAIAAARVLPVTPSSLVAANTRYSVREERGACEPHSLDPELESHDAEAGTTRNHAVHPL